MNPLGYCKIMFTFDFEIRYTSIRIHLKIYPHETKECLVKSGAYINVVT